jgi:competence ComEA-like helix-hairpin-helix protein
MIPRLVLPAAWVAGALLWILVIVSHRGFGPLLQVVPGECFASDDSVALATGDIPDSTKARSNQSNPDSAVSDQTAPGHHPSSLSQSTADCIKVNTANQHELMNLPGIGTVLADRIIAYRTQGKSFSRPEDLRGVKGIGEKKLAKIRNLICF